MKFKNKGRKIYKTKEKNYYVKSKSSRFMSVCLSLMLVGGLVGVGYSIAEPVLNYTRKKGDGNISPSETTESILPSDTTESTSLNNSVISQQDYSVSTPLTAQSYNCASLSTDSLTSSDKLRNALAEIKLTGVEYVIVPLKVAGGKIYFFTDDGESYLTGAVISQLTLESIISEIKGIDLKPMAYFSVLEDNIYPATYPESGYKISENGSVWIDNSVENGGKPWLNPFSETALSYVKKLANEVSSAGFEKVIFADISFPPFRQSDIEYIGETVADKNRYTVLVSLANELYSDALSNGTSAMLEVSADEILSGRAEVIQPMLLSISTIVLNIDFDNLENVVSPDGMVYEFSGTLSEKAKMVLGFVKGSLSDYNVIVRLSGESVQMSELEEVKKSLELDGYNSYILK